MSHEIEHWVDVKFFAGRIFVYRFSSRPEISGTTLIGYADIGRGFTCVKVAKTGEYQMETKRTYHSHWPSALKWFKRGWVKA